MTKKPAAPEVKKKKAAEPKPEPKVEAKVEAKPKVHSSKPSSNPFTQQHPGRPGRSANGGTPGSRRGS